ncbi:hypothetical protein D3C86_1689510 [compost metagenome]
MVPSDLALLAMSRTEPQPGSRARRLLLSPGSRLAPCSASQSLGLNLKPAKCSTRFDFNRLTHCQSRFFRYFNTGLAR